jgi:hypothetical protein
MRYHVSNLPFLLFDVSTDQQFAYHYGFRASLTLRATRFGNGLVDSKAIVAFSTQRRASGADGAGQVARQDIQGSDSIERARRR